MMKKYIIALIVILGISNSLKSQTINELMENYDNLYALEHIELYTKPENIDTLEHHHGLTPPKFHRSIKIVNVDATWLLNITYLVNQDPTILYPFLELEDKNLAAFVLLHSILDIDMPEQGTAQETTSLNLLKIEIFNHNALIEFRYYNQTPSGQDPQKFTLNKSWKNLSVNEGANTRLKNAVNELIGND